MRDQDSELAVVRAELGRERGRYDYPTIVGASDAMHRIFQQLDRIIDSELPNEDGWGVLKQVRKDSALKNLKVIVFMAAKGETAQLVLIPVDAELRRPFTIGELLEAVHRVVGEP